MEQRESPNSQEESSVLTRSYLNVDREQSEWIDLKTGITQSQSVKAAVALSRMEVQMRRDVSEQETSHTIQNGLGSKGELEKKSGGINRVGWRTHTQHIYTNMWG